MTPQEFLQDTGWKFVRRGAWLVVKVCPFCSGGHSGDTMTFVVHERDGNFSCLRSKCGASGTFWKLIASTGKNPRDYIEAKPKKKRFMYGRA